MWLWYGKLGLVVVELWLLYSDGREHGTVGNNIRAAPVFPALLVQWF